MRISFSILHMDMPYKVQKKKTDEKSSPSVLQTCLMSFISHKMAPTAVLG
jgi:hypothetical protein